MRSVRNPLTSCTAPSVDGVLGVSAEPATFRELIVRLATEHLTRITAPDDPRDLGARVTSGECGQVPHRVLGGVAGADDGDPSLGIAAAVAAQHVGDARLDQVGGVTFTDRRVPVGTDRVGCQPGPGGIDHRPGEGAFETVGPNGRDHERCIAAARAGHLVGAGAGDRGDEAVGAQPDRDLGQEGQRLEVVLDELPAGGVLVGVGAEPTVGGEQTAGGRVDVVAPRREQLDVGPVADAGGDVVADFEHDERDASFVEVGGGGEADRAGADHGDGQCVGFMGASPCSGRWVFVETTAGDVGCSSENLASVAVGGRLRCHGDHDDDRATHRSAPRPGDDLGRSRRRRWRGSCAAASTIRIRPTTSSPT